MVEGQSMNGLHSEEIELDSYDKPAWRECEGGVVGSKSLPLEGVSNPDILNQQGVLFETKRRVSFSHELTKTHIIPDTSPPLSHHTETLPSISSKPPRPKLCDNEIHEDPLGEEKSEEKGGEEKGETNSGSSEVDESGVASEEVGGNVTEASEEVGYGADDIDIYVNHDIYKTKKFITIYFVLGLFSWMFMIASIGLNVFMMMNYFSKRKVLILIFCILETVSWAALPFLLYAEFSCWKASSGGALCNAHNVGWIGIGVYLFVELALGIPRLVFTCRDT